MPHTRNAAGEYLLKYYYKSYSDALTAVKKYLDEATAWEPEDWSGSTSCKRKPPQGETTRLNILLFAVKESKPVMGMLEIQVYNKGNDTPNPFELNFYITKLPRPRKNDR